jgi:hypothetical protein
MSQTWFSQLPPDLRREVASTLARAEHRERIKKIRKAQAKREMHHDLAGKYIVAASQQGEPHMLALRADNPAVNADKQRRLALHRKYSNAYETHSKKSREAEWKIPAKHVYPSYTGVAKKIGKSKRAATVTKALL